MELIGQVTVYLQQLTIGSEAERQPPARSLRSSRGRGAAPLSAVHEDVPLEDIDDELDSDSSPYTPTSEDEDESYAPPVTQSAPVTPLRRSPRLSTPAHPPALAPPSSVHRTSARRNSRSNAQPAPSPRTSARKARASLPSPSGQAPTHSSPPSDSDEKSQPPQRSSARNARQSLPILPSQEAAPLCASVSESESDGQDKPEQVQCRSHTQSGARCSREVTVPLWKRKDLVLCTQHVKILLSQEFFRSPRTHKQVEYSEFVKKYLSHNTQVALRDILDRALSQADEEGYIYAYQVKHDSETQDSETHGSETHAYVKVGRTKNPWERVSQWCKQCPNTAPQLLGCWPFPPGNERQSALPGLLEVGPPSPWCHRLEQLVHLELEDLAEGGAYLKPGWPELGAQEPGTSRSRTTRGRLAGECSDCMKKHREIFAFQCVKEGGGRVDVWEVVVKPVIERWGDYVRRHYQDP